MYAELDLSMSGRECLSAKGTQRSSSEVKYRQGWQVGVGALVGLGLTGVTLSVDGLVVSIAVILGVGFLGVCGLARRKPWVAALSVGILLIVPPMPVDVLGRTPSVFLADAFVGLFAIVTVLVSGRYQRTGWRFAPMSASVAFVFVAGASVVLFPGDILYQLARLKTIVFGILVYFTVSRWLVRGLPSRSVLAGVVAVAVFFAVVVLAAVGGPGSSGLLDVIADKNLVRTAYGKNNYLAAILVLGAPLAVGFGLENRRSFGKVGWFGAAVILVGAALATQSSGALLSLGVGAVVGIACMPGIRRKVLSTLGALVVGGFLWVTYGGEILTDFGSVAAMKMEQVIEVDGVAARRRLWETAAEIFWAYPVAGIGLGNASSVYSSVYGYERPTTSHNYVLDGFSELGVLGGLPLSVWVGGLAWAAVGGLRKEGGMSPAEAGACVSVLVGLIHGLGEVLLFSEIYSVLFWALAAVVAVRSRQVAELVYPGEGRERMGSSRVGTAWPAGRSDRL